MVTTLPPRHRPTVAPITHHTSLSHPLPLHFYLEVHMTTILEVITDP